MRGMQGAKGRRAHPPGPRQVLLAQRSHSTALAEGADIQLWSGELSVLTVS